MTTLATTPELPVHPGDVARCDACGHTFVQRARHALACRRCRSPDVRRWRATDLKP